VGALDGVFLKLDRAEHVIKELYEAIVEYLAEHNYRAVGHFERERSEYVFLGEVTKPTAYLSVIIGEVVHDMRSALDHLAWQLALLTTPTPYDLTQFPIALTPGEFGRKRGQEMIQDLLPKHRALIETFQPYHRVDRSDAFGPPALRDLRFLSNTDKHRLLNATIARKVPKLETRGLRVRVVKDVTSYGPVEWFPEGDLIDGAVIARVPLQRFGPKPKMKVEASFPSP
jgi:hypothetical protein